jgi:hypothetical protein
MATKTKKVMRKASASTRDYSNHPFVSNYPPLKEWLDKHEARCMWQIPSHPRDEGDLDWYPQYYIEGWLVKKRIVVLQIYSNKMGWNIFTDCGSNKVDDALADAEQRLNIVENPATKLAKEILDRTHSETECNTPEDAEKLAKLVFGNKE